MRGNASKWFLGGCLILSGAILAGGLVQRAQAHLWLSTINGSPYPLNNANRDCFTLPDGAVKQTCSGSKAWDVVIPIISNCFVSACEVQTGLYQLYTAAQSPSAANLVNSRLYGYNSAGVFYTASAFANHTYLSNQVSWASHSVTIPLDGSAIIEWNVPQNGFVSVVGYNPN